ncbi:MAG: hypothetical protein LBE09_00730 [Christensenellaceae bacterium]|jgi:dsRNA-specific ribonuclease|nr:hypothetical protein [Christensenellaceae bacterium]
MRRRIRCYALLTRIFTHSSYGNQYGIPHNETLAMLGDAALKLAFSRILFDLHTNISKGVLTECKKILEVDEIFANLEIVERLFPYLKR